MKYLDEFSDPVLAKGLLADITRTVRRPWAIMEVCGGQTHTIIRNGIDQLLPAEVRVAPYRLSPSSRLLLPRRNGPGKAPNTGLRGAG
jgi:hydrogenase expression/formation protein HypD